MDKIINDIAKNIKKYRKLNGMTQKDLADYVGVSTAAVSNWETASNSIDIDVLFKVCDALGVPISLMTASDNDFELTYAEEHLINCFRSSSDLTQLCVCKILGARVLPPHLRQYDLLYIEEVNRPQKDLPDMYT